MNLMKRIIILKHKGEKILMRFYGKKQPDGRDGDLLASWIGVLAREFIPITISDWRLKSLKKVKHMIWDEIQQAFVIPNEYKKMCLSCAGESARYFRYDLSTLFKKDPNDKRIFERPDIVKNYYTSITDKHWKEFVNIRLSDEFKEVSDQNKANRALVEYPSRSGRNGYRKLDQMLVRVLILYFKFNLLSIIE